MTIERIISGGQTGADQGGLEAAEILGIPTGGFMPKGFRTEDGPRPDLAERFGLTEHSQWSYKGRTKTNVNISNLTICFGNLSSAGSKYTRWYCDWRNKVFLHVRYPLEGACLDEGTKALIKSALKYPVVNIAGNRESGNPGIQEFTRNTLVEAFRN